MDILELQRRCREIAGEREARNDRRKEHLDAWADEHPEPEPPSRVWVARAEFEQRQAQSALAYYAHVAEYEGRSRSSYRLKSRRKK